MSISAGFLIYAALYRLTVLAVGALSIWLGFRLFSQFSAADSGSGNRASASAGKFKLALTNVLPGTYFALFGTVLIGIMLWQGPPQLTLKDIEETTAEGTRKTNTIEVRASPVVQLDGWPNQTAPEIQAAIDQEWKKLDKRGLTLPEAAEPLSNIARIWQQEGRIGEAVAMARLAYLYGPEIDKATHLSLFAELLEANGKVQDAAEARAELDNLRKQGGGAGE